MLFTNWKDEVDHWNQDIIDMDDNNKTRLYEKLKSDDVNKIHVGQGVVEQEKTQMTDAITFENMLEIISKKTFSGMTDLENLNNMLKVLNWCSNKDYNEYVNVLPNDIVLGSKNDINIFYNAINWICLTLNYFIVELKIPEIKDRVYTGLVRSSYKLCPQKSNCCYQYPDDENMVLGCKNQHYPYANLYVDALSIKMYIHNYINKNSDTLTSKFVSAYSETKSEHPSNDILHTTKVELNVNELKRCLSTLHYVILIMYRELETIVKYRSADPNFNIRKFHKYHSMHKFNKRKTDATTNDTVKTEHIFEREKVPHHFTGSTQKANGQSQSQSQSQKLSLLKEAQKIQQIHYATHRNVKPKS